MDRYRVTLTRDGRKFGILDRDSYDYCGLPDEAGRVKPLEWELREGAEAWLQRCYRWWKMWETDPKRRQLVPLRWRPLPPAPSPFEPSSWSYDR
jgi:hypothetical protein